MGFCSVLAAEGGLRIEGVRRGSWPIGVPINDVGRGRGRTTEEEEGTIRPAGEATAGLAVVESDLRCVLMVDEAVGGCEGALVVVLRLERGKATLGESSFCILIDDFVFWTTTMAALDRDSPSDDRVRGDDLRGAARGSPSVAPLRLRLNRSVAGPVFGASLGGEEEDTSEEGRSVADG